MKKAIPGASSNQIYGLQRWLEIPSASACSVLAQQWHARNFKGLLMVIAFSYKYSEINTYIPHGWVKVKMLALVEGFLLSFTCPVPMA